jgi:two-component system LytT family response regulator
MLQPHGFLRVHQSHLVNTNYIHAFLRKDGGYLKMNNGDDVPVSVRKKAEVMELLDNL